VNSERSGLTGRAPAWRCIRWPLIGAAGAYVIAGAYAVVTDGHAWPRFAAHVVMLASVAIAAWMVSRHVSRIVHEQNEALRASRARLEGIIASAMDAIISTDEDQHIIIFNAAAEMMFRCPAAEAIGSHLERFIPERFRHVHREAMRRFGESSVTQRLVGVGGGVAALRADGEEFPSEASISHSDASGRKLYTVVLRDVTARKRTEQELETSRTQLRALAARVESVREEERTRLARDVHDQLGHALTALKMDLAWLGRRGHLDNPVAAEQVRGMTELLDETIRQVRRMATNLRPPVLDDVGLAAAIEWQARDFETRTGITCQLTTELPERELDRDVATAIFRIFQEALTNVARHAGASVVEVRMPASPDHVVLIVEDNGRGITAEELEGMKSLGILGMRERARLLKGDVTITGEPGVGTRVTVTVPAARVEAHC
jgi:PAS domain S-box-containing protein